MKSQKRPVLYIGNLDESMTESFLYSVFIPFGEIKTLDIPIEPATNTHKGHAFIEYEEQEDADHAIENMNDAEVCGKIIKVLPSHRLCMRDRTNSKKEPTGQYGRIRTRQHTITKQTQRQMQRKSIMYLYYAARIIYTAVLNKSAYLCIIH